MTRGWVRVALGLSIALAARAQEAPPPGGDEDPAALRRRLDELESKVRALESERATPAAESAPSAEPAPVGTGAAPIGTSAPVDSSAVGVALGEAGEGLLLELPLSVKVKLRGHYRLRGEFRDPRDYRIPGTFGRPATENPDSHEDFLVQRVWLGFEFTVKEHLRAAVAVQDVRFWGDTPVGQENAELSLREGWVELHHPFDLPLDVRAGRDIVPTFGDGRLFSAIDPWGPVTRLWDALRVTLEPKGWVLTGFAANLREAQVQVPRGDDNDDFWISGVYASNRMIEGVELDSYLFWRVLSDDVFLSEPRGGNGFVARAGDRKDFTAGARVKVEQGPVGATAEGVFQWGDQAGDTVQAWAAAARAWVKLPLGDDLPKVRLVGEYAYATGDEDPNDGRNQTFDAIFPFGHFYHGHMDLVGWANIHALTTQLTLGMPKPVEWLELHADGHAFWLDKTRDAWFSAGRAPIRRQPNGSADSFLGTELDLYLQVRLWEKRVFIWTGYSHFWTGKYVRETGKSEDQRWAFLMLEVNF